MTTDELKLILDDHAKWARGEGGKRADLSFANLRSANLSSANLSSANLSSADLRSANLRSADLRSANLRSANLRSANLSSANLSSANLSFADLSFADLRSADLSYAQIAWDSHALLADILRKAAGQDRERRKVAGLISISLDWCWKDFLAMDDPQREWAIGELRKWVTVQTPAEICVYLGVTQPVAEETQS